MSRCFPYPPPGCAGKLSSSRAFILSIEKEKGKPRTERKKDEKLERKEKKTANTTIHRSESKKRKKLLPDEKKVYVGEKYVKWPEEGYVRSKQDEELEKSSVTEEHRVTRQRGKRNKHDPATYCHSNQAVVTGVIARTYSIGSSQQDSSSSLDSVHLRNTDTVDPNPESSSHQSLSGNSALAAHPGYVSLTLDPINHQVQLSVSSEFREGTGSSLHHKKKKVPRVLRKYTKLFEKWTPPPLCHLAINDDLDSDDDRGWLFRDSHLTDNPVKRFMSCKKDSLPSAQRLNDMGIYVLPFTVPF